MITLIAQKVTDGWYNIYNIYTGRIVFSGTTEEIIKLPCVYIPK